MDDYARYCAGHWDDMQTDNFTSAKNWSSREDLAWSKYLNLWYDLVEFDP